MKRTRKDCCRWAALGSAVAWLGRCVLREEAVDRLDVLGGQVEVLGVEVLLQVVDAGGGRDGQDGGRAGEQSGQRGLRDGRPVPGGDGV